MVGLLAVWLVYGGLLLRVVVSCGGLGWAGWPWQWVAVLRGFCGFCLLLIGIRAMGLVVLVVVDELVVVLIWWVLGCCC